MEPTYEGRSWLPMQDIDIEHWKEADIILPEPDFPNLDIPLTIRMAREYYSSVHSVDRNVGRILDQLDELGIAENTIIIFTSDHGYNLGHNGLWHKGNGRWLTKDGMDPAGIYGDSRPNLYDNSMRVPCIIRWPDKIDENTKIEATVSFPDFFPTLLEMAGLEKPKDILFRGESILPLFRNEPIEWNNDLYAEYINLRTYRTPEWKIVLDFSEKEIHEFYNLKDDPKEHHNLFKSELPTVAHNRNIFMNKLIEVSSYLPINFA
jgi:choline-sulfatase